MPGNRVRAIVEERLEGLILSPTMHKMDFREASRGTTGRVDVQSAEISAIFKRLFDGQFGKVLVAKSYNFALCNEECQFILALLIELRDLDSRDLGADRRSNILDLAAWLQEVLEALISVLAMLYMLERLKRVVSVKECLLEHTCQDRRICHAR